MSVISPLRCALLALLLGACGVPQAELIQQAQQRMGSATMVFDFETGTQGWANNGQQTACPDANCFTAWVGQGNGQAENGPVFEGQGALKYRLANATTKYFEVAHYPSSGHEAIQLAGAGSNGTVVKMSIWLPKGAATHISAIQAFVKTGPSPEVYNKQYLGNYTLVEDAWTVVGIYIPPKTGADASVNSVGLAFSMNDTTMNDDLYIDSVSYFTP